MVIPFLTVTGIGLLIGAAGHLLRTGGHALWLGFFGSWAGFAAGGVIGIIVDVTAHSGVWVSLLGHVTAIVGAVASQFADVVLPEESGS